MDYRVIIIDGSYVARSSFECGNMLKGFVARVFDLGEKYEHDVFVVAWDSYNEPERCKIYSDYKRERREKNATWEHREAYEEQLNELKESLTFLGVEQYHSEGWEADDVIATICKRWVGDKLIFSPDHDLLQLVYGDVSILRPGKSEIITQENIKTITGLSSEEHLDVMTLAGCRGDGVPGIDGIADKRATRLINACPDIIHLLLKNDLPSKNGIRGQVLANDPKMLCYVEKAITGVEQVKRNRQLVELQNNVELQNTPVNFDLERSIVWLTEHGLEYHSKKLIEGINI